MRNREKAVCHYDDDMGPGKGSCTWGVGILAHAGPCTKDELASYATCVTRSCPDVQRRYGRCQPHLRHGGPREFFRRRSQHTNADIHTRQRQERPCPWTRRAPDRRKRAIRRRSKCCRYRKKIGKESKHAFFANCRAVRCAWFGWVCNSADTKTQTFW